MIIFFSASSRNLQNDLTTYRRITNAVRLAGHTIHNDWVETQWLRDNALHETGKARSWDIKSIVRDVEKSIENADLVVVEGSGQSAFGVGYELASALYRKKPVLVLVRRDAAPMSYATGLESDLLTYKQYDETNLEQVIGAFLAENIISTKDLRFNFVIDNKLYNHIRWKSFKSKKTKAEVVRELLLRDMENGA